MSNTLPNDSPAIFDLHAVAASLPASASTMLIDTRLTDLPNASTRVFRIYRPTPAHFHITCDEYLVVLSGRALFFSSHQAPVEVRPGHLIFFRQNTVHGITRILEEPLIFFSVDTPRRDPGDIHFVNPEDGTPETFIQSVGVPESNRRTD